MLCYAILFYSMLCFAMLCYSFLFYAMPCGIRSSTARYPALCFAMLSCAMLCYALLFFSMLCYAMLCCDSWESETKAPAHGSKLRFRRTHRQFRCQANLEQIRQSVFKISLKSAPAEAIISLSSCFFLARQRRLGGSRAPSRDRGEEDPPSQHPIS
jgi:hypothetical protein